MSLSHSKKQFDYLIKSKKNFIFFKKINNFNFNPIPSFIDIVENNKFSFLYESVEKQNDKGRYSICGFEKIKTIILKKKILEIKNLRKKRIFKNIGNPLVKVDEVIKKNKFHKNKILPPMAGSFFGYLSYENIYNIEEIKKFKKRNVLKTPEILLFIPKILIIFDNVNGSIYVVRHILKENFEKINFDRIKYEVNEIEKKINIKNKDININLNKKTKLSIKSNVKRQIYKKYNKGQKIHSKRRYFPSSHKPKI